MFNVSFYVIFCPGFDPLEESSRGLADLLEKENGQKQQLHQHNMLGFSSHSSFQPHSRQLQNNIGQNLPPGNLLVFSVNILLFPWIQVELFSFFSISISVTVYCFPFIRGFTWLNYMIVAENNLRNYKKNVTHKFILTTTTEKKRKVKCQAFVMIQT